MKKNGISDAQIQKRRPRLIIIFFVGNKEAWYIICNMYYICYRLFQLNLPILIWTDSRILRLWLSATLMHFSNYNFFSIVWGLGRFPSLGRSHTQNCFGLQFIAMHKIKISSLWQTLGQGIARWLLHWLQPCNCWYWRELWPPIRIGMPLQDISVLHYMVLLFVFLCYTMLLWITYENNKNCNFGRRWLPLVNSQIERWRHIYRGLVEK